MKKRLILCVLLIITLSVKAQKNEVFTPNIQSLLVKVNNNWLAPPIINLNSDDVLEVSFDELSHEYHRFQYIISHCNADWTLSGLNEIDYLEGFNNSPIEDYQNSVNTTMLYTHYRISFPNEQVKFKVSGNYIISIYNDDDNSRPVCKACFSILEKKVSVSASVSSNTDIDNNKSHQQVSFSVNYAGYNIRIPQSELKINVMQNLREDNCATNILPSYVSPNELKYEYNKNLIFNAGNEYRRFEMVSVKYAAQGVQSIRFFDPYYHVTLFPDELRIKNYSFDKDQNGRYLVRYDWATNNDTEADYFLVHFSLPWKDALPNGDFYLQGAFTNDNLTENYRLKYNPATKDFETTQLLKQGAYNYQYLFLPAGSDRTTEALTEGNYYETENEYLILVYHRPFGERYDRLIGMQQVNFK
ncbi:DUF5103 domain-containing protein [uncultured Bacteroides sp.]|uniref:type IX secretion system plug protein n=1 Tax=uncultured Bacteroides sp. TaxID=162156 RepID=UPI002AA8617F|nr:DUF5103 domain-containing protein [uncultured Bacteroides sp.]